MFIYSNCNHPDNNSNHENFKKGNEKWGKKIRQVFTAKRSVDKMINIMNGMVEFQINDVWSAKLSVEANAGPPH